MSFLTPVLFWWLPLAMCLSGLAVCILQGSRKRSMGLLLLGVVFAIHVAGKILAAMHQANMPHDFVQRQIGPNQWTAPIMDINVAAPVLDGLLLLAAILVARRISATAASAR